MSQNILEERLKCVQAVLEKQLTIKTIAESYAYSESSLKRWLSAYRKHGVAGLLPKSTRPKRLRRPTAPATVQRILELRKSTGVCAQKLHWKLKKQGLLVSVSAIGKILKTAGLVKKYRIKKTKYKYIAVARQAGDLVEVDVKFVPGRLKDKRYYQYTAIDTASRWRYLKIYQEQSNSNSIDFLKTVIKEFARVCQNEIVAIKTDNGAIFTNYYTALTKRSDSMIPRSIHQLDQFCNQQGIIHYLIDPGKPAQNGKVERSHREDQEKFYEKNTFTSLRNLRKKLRVWNDYYNDLEHCGLGGKSPNEMLK
jgi:transposase